MKAWCAAAALAAAAASPLRAPAGKAAPRVCSDAELATYALALAFGPGPRGGGVPPAAPRCAPAPGQSLWPARAARPRAPTAAAAAAKVFPPGPGLAGPLSLGTAGRARRGAGRAANDSAAGAANASGGAHMVHVLVVQSHEGWCAPPCEQPTWEMQAPKPESGSPYRLLEAAIWWQDRKVTLYRFDDQFEQRARNTYNRICMGSWSCPYYAVYREGHKLVSIGPWPQHLDSNGAELSAWLKDAFKQVFQKVSEEEPGVPVALTYTGHGASADGSLFEGSIGPADAAALLGYVTGVGGAQGLDLGRLAVLNFGGNCAEGRWKMIDWLHPFAEWITASDLLVGGLNLTSLSQEEQTNVTQAQGELDDLAVFKQACEARTPVEDMLRQMVQAREDLWNGVLSGPITDQRLRQTIAVFATEKFEPFAHALRESYHQLTSSQRTDFEQQVTAAECDVKVAAEALDGGVSAGALQSAFLELRPIFGSTKELFQWDVETNGLGFNFLGWRGDEGCDFASALSAAA